MVVESPHALQEAVPGQLADLQEAQPAATAAAMRLHTDNQQQLEEQEKEGVWVAPAAAQAWCGSSLTVHSATAATTGQQVSAWLV